jgi:Flp pilus assembly protein TadB
VFLFKRSSEQQPGQQRGPGGGRVRSRQRRRERVRREPGLIDTASYTAIVCLVLLLVYRFVLRESWAVSLIFAVIAWVGATSVSYLLSRRRRTRLQPPSSSQRRSRRR